MTIDGVTVVPLTVHQDDRGYLMEIARAHGDELHAVVHQFGQVYLVGDHVRGTIRAYHKHAQTWDWFCIVHGAAKFVLKDDRQGSSTYGNMMTIVMSERAPKLLTVPPDVWHGWMSLEDDTLLISIASHTYNREQPDETRIPPHSFTNVWRIRGR